MSIMCTDGSRFNGILEKGQVWVKGNREKVIVDFNNLYMFYQTKTDIKKGNITRVFRKTFSDWATSGAMLKKDNV
ncbi:hypothetical protein [Priestia aryabhattai]|uniref:hypothetical protein n=1 Tax=Priestia aryabhattai TaxID=412384 RepID=UPI0015F57505|nr:hypothetical protein [Priestia aryabhattai]